MTGGTGVVGTGTVTELLKRGHEVVLLSRHAHTDARQWPAGVVAQAGGRRECRLHSRCGGRGCDVVLHMVGIVDESDGATFAGVNVGGTANMLAETERAKVKRFVFVSSLGAPEGESDYHASKREAEALVRRFHGQWVIARPGNVYGPGDEQISLLLRHGAQPEPGHPADRRRRPADPAGLVGGRGVALANVVERTDLGGRELDVAGPELTSQNDLVARLGRITGREVHGVSVPDFVATLGCEDGVARRAGTCRSASEQVTMLHEGNAIPAAASTRWTPCSR